MSYQELLQFVPFITLCVEIVVISLSLLVLHKINRVKKQIDSITKEVKRYVEFIMEDTKLQEERELSLRINNQLNKKASAHINSDEEKNRLIQSVLGEIFP
ncbi:MAG: hypothetical protein IKJ01_01315 [Lachnospiraceae bacterium]|nr:hypothetical protein [Lachnospiraceae bacterium]